LEKKIKEKHMSKVETICPFCRKPNAAGKNSFDVSANGVQAIQCSHCSKRWEENFCEGPLVKAAPPVPSREELTELQAQVRGQLQGLTQLPRQSR
jgi:hypothetical protein